MLNEEWNLSDGVAVKTSSDFPYWAWVACNQRIYRQQSDAFDRGLRYENTVEGIFVDGWKAVDGDSMFANNWQFAITIVQQASTEEPSIHLKVLAIQTLLDCDLPQGWQR